MKSNAGFLYFERFRRSKPLIFLAFMWCGGLLFGVYSARGAGNVIVSMMLTVCQSRMSIIGLIFSTVFPFLITASAVFLSAQWLIYPLAFIKGFTYTFCFLLVSMAFGSAGWLIQWLLLFSAGCSAPCLYWLWIRCLSSKSDRFPKDLLICGSICLFVAILDFCLVSPFLASLY